MKIKASRRPTAFVVGSIGAAALASFCCILPIVFALTGLTVAGAAAAFAPLRPYLLGAAFVLLGIGFYFTYRIPRRECAPGSTCAVPASLRRIRITLWLAAILVLGLAAFPYFSGAVAEFLLSGSASGSDSPEPATSGFKRPAVSIEDMDRSVYTTAIQDKLKTLRGVLRAGVSFERSATEVEFDPGLLPSAGSRRSPRGSEQDVRKEIACDESHCNLPFDAPSERCRPG